MWIRAIIWLIIISVIDDYWEQKIKKEHDNKRKYRFLKGLMYFAISVICVLLANYISNLIYIYAVFSILTGIGSILSAINPNFRDMYIAILVLGAIISVISFYYERNRIIFTIVDIWMVLGIITAIKEGVHNMRYGIDPDVIAEQKAAEKKFKNGIKLAKVIFKIWRWW